MASDKDVLNLFACALLDVLTDEGAPESYLHIVAEQAGIANPGGAVSLLVIGGLLSIAPGHRVVPGREWPRVKAAYEAHKLNVQH